MLKILQARLQQYMNQELPYVQAGFRKARGTRNQIANIRWIIEKKKESSRKTSISASLTTPKPSTVWITTNWKILKEMGITDHLTCLLRNLHAGQEATVRIKFTVISSRKPLIFEYFNRCPCSPRDSQESAPKPQFKSINSLALNFLHSPTLTSICDHWKNHSFD